VIRVNVLYPAVDGARFDSAYYLQRHIPMVKDRLQPFGLTEVTVDRGLAGLVPGTPARHVCVASLAFSTTDALQGGLAAHGAEILSDVPNYTDIQPVIDVAEVLM
jgi:uncharacterized protein (TIGR02118 family)